MAEWGRQIKGFVGALARAPGRILFAPACPGCRRLVAQPGVLCAACWPRLKLLDPPWCPVLGLPFEHDMGEGFLSAEAIASPPPFARARAAVAYDAVAGRMVHGLKYGDRTDFAPWMAAWMARAGFELLPDADLIVPVPLHPARFFKRRFNQSAELARALALQTGVAFDPSALVRRKRTRQQVSLGRNAREDNVRAAFEVPPAARPALKGKHALLVDDVYTTGATVASATRALLAGGCRAVDVLTFARVLPGDFLSGDQGPI
jgi:ComF family protein